ncbi:MAG TPA: periplasmic heavy metal sensor [Saprospiraceae bacterium]|nr:periplasmic heavy metal sensor [Saprospiraceae bacterium]
MDNPRVLKIALIVLLILNLSSMAFMWLNKPRTGPPHHGEDTFKYLVHELNMNDEQQNKYKLLRDEHHHGMELLQDKSRDLHNAFFKLLQNPSNDSSSIKLIGDSIAGNQMKIEMLTFDHFKKVRAICTPQQQKKFDDIILETLKRMAPRPPQK